LERIFRTTLWEEAKATILQEIKGLDRLSANFPSCGWAIIKGRSMMTWAEMEMIRKCLLTL
uniref:Uncharacterized protein n=1 Tax=Sciurus vulgaris TaxID=55149 RepID=A0A8D2CNK7_SCIVU